MKFKVILTFCCLIYLGTESSAKLLNKLPRTNCDASDTVEIYSKWNDGCLDGRLDFFSTFHFVFLYVDCPKWRLETNGRLISTRPVVERCLDCTLGEIDCILVGHNCNEYVHQKFFLRTYWNQIDYKNGRYYFSINSQKYPSRCLTVYEGHNKVHKDSFNSEIFLYPKYLQRGALHAGLGNSSFRLEECTGSTRQSFYFKKNWQEEIDDFLNEVNNK